MFGLHVGLMALSPQNGGGYSRRSALYHAGSAFVGAPVASSAIMGGAVPAGAAAPPVASSSLVLPPIGIGAWAWGDSLFWGYDQKNDGELKELFEYYAAMPNAFFDTAEIYGFGRSETLLGEFERSSGRKVAIASKFAALPWKTKREDVVKACQASLKRMGRDSMELYQIHVRRHLVLLEHNMRLTHHTARPATPPSAVTPLNACTVSKCVGEFRVLGWLGRLLRAGAGQGSRCVQLWKRRRESRVRVARRPRHPSLVQPDPVFFALPLRQHQRAQADVRRPRRQDIGILASRARSALR